MSERVSKAKASDGGLGETIKIVVQALLLALVVRTFLYQPFNIPSGSMIKTLLVGDYIFVSKFSYGFSKYSFPFSPDLFDGRVWAGEPERGDVAVFRLPTNTNLDYVKRVVGLPGDRISVQDGVLFINGTAVERREAGEFDARVAGLGVPPGRTADVYIETLPNGVSYSTLDLTPLADTDNFAEVTVPEGHYFMMGDNRDNSADSRTSQVGFVPLENFIGRAEVIFFSIGDGARPWQLWRWPGSLRVSRFFDGL
ncbi:MAG: signal peptidase I [Pseudomonadota bacterium]